MALPDANAKITFFFKADGGTYPAGWTENFYSTGGVAQATLDNAWTAYVSVRADMLGVGAQIQSARIASPTVPGQVNPRITFVRFAVGAEGQGKTFSDPTTQGFDPTQVDLLCRVATAEGKKRQFWVAGIPDDQTYSLKQQGIVSSYINSPAFKQFVKAMIKAGFCVRWRNNPGVLPATYSATPFLTCQPVMVRNHKRGRPFYLVRGKRLA